MLRLPVMNRLIKSKGTKIQLYFATKVADEGFDTYEANYTMMQLTSVTIKGYVTEVSPEALVWKQYGLKEMGAKEVICDAKYSDWIRNASKVVIDGDEYSLFKEGTGNRTLIQKRPAGLIRVILSKKG